jgi:hypothetical protein
VKDSIFYPDKHIISCMSYNTVGVFSAMVSKLPWLCQSYVDSRKRGRELAAFLRMSLNWNN